MATIEDIERTLGTNPSGPYSDVRVRLDILESRINNPNDPSPVVTNPVFIDGYGGISFSVGDGIPIEDRVEGSIYIQRDGYMYIRRDGIWSLFSDDGGSAPIFDHNLLLGLQGGSSSDGYYHLTSNEYTWLIDGYTQGVWQSEKGGTGYNVYNTGDILYGDTDSILSTLPIGNEGDVLTVSSSGLPNWEAPTSLDGYYNKEEIITVLDGYAATEIPNQIDEVSYIGISQKFAREDHTHQLYDGYINKGAGPCYMPTYTNNGDGTVTLGDICANLHSTNDFTGYLKTYRIFGETFDLIDQSNNYIVARYNDGEPDLYLTQNVSIINESDIVPVMTFYRDSLNIYYLKWDSIGNGMVNRIHQRLVKTSRFVHESGLTLGESTTRLITITSGNIWHGAHQVTCSPFNSSTDNMELWYYNGTTWTKSTITQYDNTQYYNTATNSLSTLSNARYAVNWVYKSIEEQQVIILLGEGDYNLNAATLSRTPSIIPEAITATMILVGRIIVKKSDSTATEIDSAFTSVFQGTISQAHNELSNLQGGTVNEYYHLTSDEYSDFQNIGTTLVDGYYNKTEIGTILDGYSNVELPEGLLDGYYNKEEIGIILDGYTTGTGTGSGENFNLQFDNTDLDLVGEIAVTHSLGTQNILAQIFDSDGYLIMPDEFKIVDSNSAIIKVATFQPIIGIWNVVISSGSGIPEGLLDGYYNKEEVNILIDGYYNKTEIGIILDGYSSVELPAGLLDGYYNKTEIGTILDGYSSVELPTGLLDGYYNKIEIGTILDGYSVGGNSYFVTITDDDLTLNKVTINHGLDYQYVLTEIYDGYNEKILPDEITILDSNNIEIDLETFVPLYGSYHISIFKLGSNAGGYSQSFVDADLVGDVITITHGLNKQFVISDLYDGYDQKVIPNYVKALDNNNLEIGVASFTPLYGTYNVIVTAGAGSSVTPDTIAPRYITDSSIVARWKLNEQSGTTIYDSIADGYNLSFRGSPVIGRTARLCSSVAFVANSGLWGADILNLNPTAMSVSAWFRPMAGTGNVQYIVMKGYNSSWGGIHYSSFSIYTDANHTQIYSTVDIGAGDVVTTGVGLPNITYTQGLSWYHVGATFDGSNIKLYLNGELKTTKAASGSIDWGTNQNWTIGNCHLSGTDRYFNGRIEDVVIYNSVKNERHFRDIWMASITGIPVRE